MRIHNFIVTATLFVFFTVSSTNAQKPSTAEDQARIVELARLLETDPLGKNSKKARQWFTDWVAQTAVRKIPTCSGFFESEDRNKYSEQLSLQFKISTAAFMIEHANQAQDPETRLLAGIAGMLKAYTKILQTSPKSTSRFLDSILTMQNNNQISRNVREIVAQCSDVPLSDKSPRLPDGELVYAPIEVERLPFVARLPFPEYVPSARSNRTQGKVVLHVVLGATGKVTNVEVIRGLRDGLTESSVRTAQTIRFEPALVGGKPVSVLFKVEYTFFIQ
jgi:TonB family protein